MAFEMAFPLIVFLAVAGVVLGASAVLGERRQVTLERLQRQMGAGAAVAVATGPQSSTLLRERDFSRFRGLNDLLVRSDFAERLAADLARADLPLRVGEYLLLRWICVVAGIVLGWVVAGSPVFAVAGAAGGYLVPKFYVKHRQTKRTRSLEGQLVDAMTMMASSLRAGHSFLQGMEVVAKELPAPISVEFGQTVEEMNLGASAEEALQNMTKRVRSYDLDMVVTAILIQRSSGGNLAEVLERVAHTIRERFRILREVQVRTSAGRLTGLIVGCLPIIMAVVLSMMSPTYMDVMLSQSLGQIMLVAAGTFQLMGFYIIRRITDIEV